MGLNGALYNMAYIPNLVTYVSPVINLKTLGLTSLFTISNSRFVPISSTIICVSATAPNSDSSFNVGWTAASYDNFISGAIFQPTVADDYSSSGTVSSAIFPANTLIKANVTSIDTGTALTGKIVITGFYL